MKLLDIGAPPDRLAAAILDAIAKGVAVVPMGSVFVIVAAPSLAGAAALDRTKGRRAGKYYSTSFAEEGRLGRIACRSRVAPLWFEALDAIRGALLRIPIAAPDLETPALCGGVHQALRLDEPLRSIFRLVEAELGGVVELELFGGRPCVSVLSTSCNVSGDPAGTITDPGRALAFSRDRGVSLHVDGPTVPGPGFPIVEISGRSWCVRRPGDLDAFLRALPDGASRSDA